MPSDFAAPPRWPTRIAIVTLVTAFAVLAAGPLIGAGLDYRLGLALFALGAVVAGLGALVTAFFLIRKRGPQALLAVALIAGAAAALIPAGILVNASGVPRIHDISTDTADPPPFVALLALRGADASPPGYDGPAAATAQRVAYPDLAGLLLNVAPRAAFDRAAAAASASGWQIVASDPASGRIEAIATVPWWGFKDDVAVRVKPDGAGSRIDVRSKSRVGEGDLGVNAARIRAYLARLR